MIHLGSRLSRLEKLLGNEASRLPTVKTSTQPAAAKLAEDVGRLAHSDAQTSVQVARQDNRVLAWLADDWLMKLGALLMLMSFAWLARFAFLHNIIGPYGRITLGIVAGVVLLMWGFLHCKKHIEQGGVLLVLGSSVILVTLFAARELYDFFTPVSVLAVMFLSVSFVAFASVKYRQEVLAIVSLIMAAVAPLLVDAPSVEYISLFWYLTVVIFGSLWIIAITGWKRLAIASLAVFAVYSLPHIFQWTAHTPQSLVLFAYAFAAAFFVLQTMSIVKNHGKDFAYDAIGSVINGILLLGWIAVVVVPEWRSLLCVVWLIVFSCGSYAVYRTTKLQEPFIAYALVGIAYLGAALAFELEGSALVIALTLEVAVASLLVYYVTRQVATSEAIALLLSIPAVLSLQSVTSKSWSTGVLHKDFFVLVILAATLMLVGYYFWNKRRNVATGGTINSEISATMIVIGSAYAYVTIWLSLHAAFVNDSLAVMYALICYTIIGLSIYVYARIHSRRGLALYSGTLLCLVVGRLLTIDVWYLTLTWRIVTFFLMGLLLIGSAFIGRKK